MHRHLKKFLPLGLMLTLFTTGCAEQQTATPEATKPAAVAPQKQEAKQYAGKLLDKSNKAKVISIEVGQGAQVKTVMIKFDDKTKWHEDATKDHAVIVKYEVRNGEEFATEVNPKLAQMPPGVTEMKTAEMKDLLDKKMPLTLVDSRPAGRYAQDHLPGAISIPDDVLKEKKAEVLPKEKDKMLVFYCGGVTCGLSPNSAKLARELGYTNVRVYLEGEPAWRKKGYPLFASNKFVTEGNIVLIDLRDAKKAETARIARSVSIPFATFKSKVDDIPSKANVILYGDSEQQALDAMKILSEEGYKKVALVAGGLEGWQKSGGQVAKGPVETKITWKRKPVAGEVSLADFKKAAAGQDPNALIVDVRSTNETAEGKLKNATLIPLDELGKRATELPKGKKVFVHCSTGQRAEMAVKEMKKNGVDAYFLVADVECKGENCTFSE